MAQDDGGKRPQDTYLDPKRLNIPSYKQKVVFSLGFLYISWNMNANLPGNGTESEVVWITLAVDRMWHGSALIPLAVVLLGVSLVAPRAFLIGSWVVLATGHRQDGPREAQGSPKIAPRKPQHASRYLPWPKARRHK